MSDILPVNEATEDGSPDDPTFERYAQRAAELGLIPVAEPVWQERHDRHVASEAAKYAPEETV